MTRIIRSRHTDEDNKQRNLRKRDTKMRYSISNLLRGKSKIWIQTEPEFLHFAISFSICWTDISKRSCLRSAMISGRFYFEQKLNSVF